jgi:DNA-binding GntR family transcriptional regulator
MSQSAPRYVQVAEVLSERIAAGRHAIGDFLPTESELCVEFGISRHTAREALRRLMDAGLVRRRQGSGTEVVAFRAHRAYVHQMRSPAGLFQYAADTTFRIERIETGVPPEEAAADLDGRVGEPWLIVEGLRLDPADGSAICVSTVYVSAEFAGIAADLQAHSGAIYPMIEARFGIEVADVEQVITSPPMPAPAARALGVSRKVWAVRVVRRYRDRNGRLMLVSVNHHPGDRFSYTMSLRREGRGPG